MRHLLACDFLHDWLLLGTCFSMYFLCSGRPLLSFLGETGFWGEKDGFSFAPLSMCHGKKKKEEEEERD